MNRITVWMAALLFLAACSGPDTTGGTHTGEDVDAADTAGGLDTYADDATDTADAHRDEDSSSNDTGSTDAAADTSTQDTHTTEDSSDAPTCVCSSGPCCDGCQYKPEGTACEVLDTRQYCTAFETCGASRVRQEEQKTCDGASPGCSGPAEWVTVETVETCGSSSYCTKPSAGTRCETRFHECT